MSLRQYGLRKGRSASDLLLLLSKSWQDSLDSGRPSLVIALDIAGAFDCVWHKGLLAKLEQLGITGHLLALFSSYLHSRSLRVVVNGSTSATYPVEASVPQGSVLGHILWNIYFNDLLQGLPVGSVYADDCTVSHIYTREETANVIDAANRQLGDITTWGRRWQVQFAAKKTQAMVISRSREDSTLLEEKLKFRDDTLAIKDSINILGVEVDTRLSFDRHLETVARRASLRVTLLRQVRNLLDADGLIRLYKAQVRPVIEYSPLTWMSSAQCHLSLLD
ncbi:RNA-directed DNA polymerase from mobile element jockey [Chionoecetes opilio]|uniref:RNA-directed DNA polymerase from mobile element jockey n=1 Tax=Chionoecetes opilio TaxID=41210 RepID=A0A8J5CLF6_CHIOP|nr:RNA-directed DNA polymerase from mobile element jockey [Chionoecetes opilio]